MIYPGRDSASRVAQLANIAHESWMQDWPIEVSDPARLDEFVDLLLANKADWELSFWLLDLVLESAEDDLSSEEDKGSDLTEAELLDARDNAPAMMLPLSMRHVMDESRGYRDIDPENLWQEWCLYKSGEDPFTLTDDHL